MSGDRPWMAELRWVALAAVVVALFGAMTGTLAWIFIPAVLAYAGYHLFNVQQVLRWLETRGEAELPGVAGIWQVVHSRLRRSRRQSDWRKERLRQVFARFEDAAQAMPDGTALLNSTGDVVWLNRAAEPMLGLRHPTDVGFPIANLVRSPAFLSYLEGKHYDEPLELNSPVDENLRLLVRVVPYAEDQRLLIVRNITRLHKLEQMRKDFVANVSHELRTPLTVIVGYLETMADDPELPGRLRKPIDRMSQQSSRMCLLVEDLLRLSGLESDPGGAPRQSIDVADMLEHIRRDAGALPDAAHEIEVTISSVRRLLGEYGELYSAISNLVFNAVRYTPAGGRIALAWRDDGEDACCDVSDTGVGIDPVHIPRLTERFYRIDKARSRELGGTGLGLAIVKHVLMRHDARLEVISQVGEGSTFTCRFPAQRVAAPEPEPAPALVDFPAVRPGRRATARNEDRSR